MFKISTMSTARVQTRHSGVERPYHEATAPPLVLLL